MEAAAAAAADTRGDPRRRSALQPIHRTRLANLRELIKGRFNGNPVDLARALGLTNSYVWQLLKGLRKIGERSARHIEEKLGLGLGTLDKETGRAFERNTLLTAQLGGGETVQVIMVPLLSLRDALQKGPSRRRAMARATEFIPCPSGCSEHTYAITVDFNTMEPRIQMGDQAFIEPQDTVLEHNATYWLRLKGSRQRGVMRVAMKRDTNTFIFVTPPENKRNTEKPLVADDVTVLGRVVGFYRRI